MNRTALLPSLAALLLTAALSRAQTAPSTMDTGDLLPTEASIEAVLQRECAFLESASLTQIVDRASQQPITNLSQPNADATLARGPENGFDLVSYTSGVTYAAMLNCAEITGDHRYSDFVARRLQFLHDSLPYFETQAEKFGMTNSPLRPVLAPDALDDCGAMCAALIKARRANIGPDLQPVIDRWMNFIAHQQFRLSDGTLARHRPQPASVWADDCYMSIPAMAQAASLNNDPSMLEDASRQMINFKLHLFNPLRHLFTHGENLDQPDNPQFYWGRGNGWALMANVELLDQLPEKAPLRFELLALLREQIKAITPLQGGNGLWHQMLDKTDSYSETSCSAMFVYCIAHAINKGWIEPFGYASTAISGWNALAEKVNEQGQVEGTCVSTTFASSNVYYFNRKTSNFAGHGYGPMLLAGSEIIKLLRVPIMQTKVTNGAIHFVPKDSPTTQP